MISRVEGGLTYTQVYDAENRLVSVTVSGQTTQFIYDGDDNLVKKINPGGSSTIYIGNVYEVDKSSGGAVTRTVTYYPAGGAMRIDSTVYYILKDRLGSAYATTDASGNVVGQMRYYAFGETRLTTGNMFTDRLFTGQRLIAELGIYHFGARFFSPKLGRFLSADSIVPNLFNPQDLNHFSYVRNNPLRYTDPTGYMLSVGDDGGCFICSDSSGDAGSGPGGGTPSGGSTGGSGTSSGDGSTLEDDLQHLEDAMEYAFYYYPVLGGSSSGCNTWILWNGSDWCHHNTYTPSPICLPIFHGSEAAEWNYASRFQYPVQAPWQPVVVPPGGYVDRSVMGGDFIAHLYDIGAVYVTQNGSTMTNTTYETHIFHNGQIDRTISEGYVTTESQGTNANLAIALANQYGGPVAFEAVDDAMLVFSTLDQLSGGALIELMDSIP